MRRPATCTAKTDDEPCLATDVVERLVAGALAPLERRAIERRLDECEVCRRFVAEVMRQGGTEGGAATAATVPERASAAARRDEPNAPRLGLPLPGARVGRYRIERPLGAGGMGMVSLALDEDLKRHVVIKLVRPDLLTARGDDSSLDARLVREAQALARLSHPNVVSIFDLGRYGNQVFFAMEYVAGVDLSTYLAAQRERDDVLAKFIAAGAGLAAAHRAGVIHRDFKPANVLVGDDGAVKVADFGLARGVAAPLTQSGGGGAAARRSSLLDAVLTGVDRTVGTPAYMAPEQIAGEGVDARSDQFAYAVALVDALLRQAPNARRVQPQAASESQLAALGAELGAAGLAPAKAAALVRALAAEPAGRWPSMEALLEVLAAREGHAAAPPMPMPMPMPPGPAPMSPGPAPMSPGPAPMPAPAPQNAPSAMAPRPRARGRARRAWLGLGAAAVVAIGVAAWLAGGRAPSGPGCGERERLAELLSERRLAELAARATGPSPFDRWTAQAQVAELAARATELGAAHAQRCQGKAPSGCELPSAAALAEVVAAVQGLPRLVAVSTLVSRCSPTANRAELPAAVLRRLDAAHAELVEGDLDRARTSASASAAELGAFPLIAALAWSIAARAAADSGHADAGELWAKAAAEAERAGDDGARANALALELGDALLRHDGERAARIFAMLTSLVERRGARDGERAEVAALWAAGAEALGDLETASARWAEASRYARAAGEVELEARARVGAAACELATAAYARRARGEPASRTAGALAEHLAAQAWSRAEAPSAAQVAALEAALAYDLEIPGPTARAAPAALVRAAAVARFGDAARSAVLRGRAVAAARAAAGETGGAPFATEITRGEQAHRLLEAAAFALAWVRRGELPLEERAKAVRKARGVLFSGTWGDGVGRIPAALQLESTMLEYALVAQGAMSQDDVLSARSPFAGLPKRSLLRAEAAWQIAEHGRAASRYLQGEEDLELAIPLWKTLGASRRVATAAWWIVQESPYPRARARALAEEARRSFAAIGDAPSRDEVERWLAAHPAEAP